MALLWILPEIVNKLLTQANKGSKAPRPKWIRFRKVNWLVHDHTAVKRQGLRVSQVQLDLTSQHHAACVNLLVSCNFLPCKWLINSSEPSKGNSVSPADPTWPGTASQYTTGKESIYLLPLLSMAPHLLCKTRKHQPWWWQLLRLKKYEKEIPESPNNFMPTAFVGSKPQVVIWL